MVYDEADKVIKEPFQSLFSRYKTGLDTLVTGSDFFFNSFYLLYYKCHKINPNRSGSYIDSPDWIKNKKATINSINKKENKCLQCDVTNVLNHKKIGGHPERITKIKSFVNEYNWEKIIIHQKKMIGKKFRKTI